MTHSAFIRPAFTPITIALMILGFMIFWPLGLAMLAYILWGDRLEAYRGEIREATDKFSAKWGRECGGRHQHWHRAARTGNVAFDEWRETELKRLEEERRKLDEMRAEFDTHLRELRRARDREEFEAFMAARRKSGNGGNNGDGANGNSPKTVPDT